MPSIRLLAVAAATTLLLSAALPATAAKPTARPAPRPAAGTADLPSPAQRHAAALRAARPAAAGAVGDAAVGDADSFGRALRWLGVAQADVVLTGDCSGWGGYGCQLLSATPDKATTFAFNDLARITLPPKATNSLLCYWLSPQFNYVASNPTGAAVVARLQLSPTLTVENPVLANPAIIDPGTGLPYGGALTTSMTSRELVEIPLPAGIAIERADRDSHVCIAGFLSRKYLVDVYGLTEAQAKEFFKHQTTVRLNVRGSSRYIDHASLIYGLRIIGD